MRAAGPERAQASIFLLGLLLCGLAIFGFVVDGTRLLLARRQLQHAADAAALAGASALDENRFRESGEPTAEAGLAAEAARRALGDAGVTAEATVRVDDGGVEVAVRRRVPLQFLDLVGSRSGLIGARAFARPVLGR